MVPVPWNVKWNKLKIKTQFNLHVFTKFYLKKKLRKMTRLFKPNFRALLSFDAFCAKQI